MTYPSPLVAYTVVNKYIAGIHAGIQAAHSHVCLGYDMANGEHHRDKIGIYDHWAHFQGAQTMILLNGGTSDQMDELNGVAGKCSDIFPVWSWREPDADDLLTAITIVMPRVPTPGPNVSYWWEAYREYFAIEGGQNRVLDVLAKQISKLRSVK